MKRPVLTGVATVVSALALAGPAQAQSTPPSTIDIDSCTVKQNYDGTATKFTWAYCPIVVSAPSGQNVSFRYRSNLATYKPVKGLGFRAQSGTLSFSGGNSLLNLALAFKNRTRAQVTARLKVTLSNPVGATLTDTTATVGGAS